MTDDPHLTALAEQLGQLLVQRKLTLTLAESCTGGLCAEIITRISGSSAWFDCGFITYSNQSKEILLNVSNNTLSSFGAVSEEVAIEMGRGANKSFGSTWAIANTGVAGPGPSDGSDAGRVFVAFVGPVVQVIELSLSGEREVVRNATVASAIASFARILRQRDKQEKG